MKAIYIFLLVTCLIGIAAHAQSAKAPAYVDGTTAYFHPTPLPASSKSSKNVCELQSLDPVLTKDLHYQCVKKTEMPTDVQEQLNKHYRESTAHMLPEKRDAYSKQFLKTNVPKWAKNISCAAGLQREVFEGGYNQYGELNDPHIPVVICKEKNIHKNICPTGFTLSVGQCQKVGCPANTVIGGDHMGDCGDLESETNDCCLKCEAGKITYKNIQGATLSLCEVKNYKK